jgi:hypothetical protein
MNHQYYRNSSDYNRYSYRTIEDDNAPVVTIEMRESLRGMGFPVTLSNPSATDIGYFRFTNGTTQ